LAVCGFFLLVSACGGGGGDSAQSGGSGPPGGNNSPPTISGTPQTSVAVGEAYSFQPTASDADGDTLQFSATSLPSWASIDAATGHVTGTPTAQDVNNYPGITLSVSDGKATVSLPAFSISVTQIGTGSATVSWVPPTENEDGSALTDLARYRVLYGRTSSNLDQSLVVNNAGASTASIDNLSPGTWFFGVVAINSVGTESALSNIASKTI
jgi:hypothetical protein